MQYESVLTDIGVVDVKVDPNPSDSSGGPVPKLALGGIARGSSQKTKSYELPRTLAQFHRDHIASIPPSGLFGAIPKVIHVTSKSLDSLNSEFCANQPNYHNFTMTF